MHDFPETSHSLIARVQELGDGTSWAEFLGVYQPVVFRMARRRGLQDADALDVMQQVFLAVSVAISRWEARNDRPKFRAWLSTVARNTITKALIRRCREAASGSSTVRELLREIPDRAETGAELAAEARGEAFRWVAEQVRPEFSPETWSIFWRTAVEGAPVAEVARETGRSAGAIYIARYRVLTRLREKAMELSRHWELFV